MPRKPRKKSSTGVYHIVIRGLDRQIMFECEKDYLKYLDILSYYQIECNFELYAYCIMSNHIHLAIKIKDTNLETIFKKINTHYAVWFNMKYQRTGHLQQDRFYSEPIEDIEYLHNVIRYIHRNPINAGLENAPGETYKWSSIHEYLNCSSQITNIHFLLSFISHNAFINFTNLDSDDICLDIDNIQKRIPDDVAKEILHEITGGANSTDFQNLKLNERNNSIKLAYNKGLSIRQINRLTGISRGIIERIVHKKNNTV